MSADLSVSLTVHSMAVRTALMTADSLARLTVHSMAVRTALMTAVQTVRQTVHSMAVRTADWMVGRLGEPFQRTLGILHGSLRDSLHTKISAGSRGQKSRKMVRRLIFL